MLIVLVLLKTNIDDRSFCISIAFQKADRFEKKKKKKKKKEINKKQTDKEFGTLTE